MPTDHRKLRIETDGTPGNTMLYLGNQRVGGLISFDLHAITQDSIPTATLVVYIEKGFA